MRCIPTYYYVYVYLNRRIPWPILQKFGVMKNYGVMMSARAMSVILLILVKYLLCSNCTPSFLIFQTLFRLSDTAINVLFSFFALFFGTLARTMPAIPQSFISKLPTTKHATCFYKASVGTFIQYVCCPSCHSLYQWKECIIHLPDNQLQTTVHLEGFPITHKIIIAMPVVKV